MRKLLKKPRRSYHHGDLRRALISTAMEEVASGGAETLNLRDLARKLGVSPAAPYRHFADRDALLTAVADEAATRLTAEVTAARAAAPADAMSQYRAIGISHVRFAAAHPAHFRAMYSPTLLAKVQRSSELGAMQAGERALVRGAQARGELPAHISVESIQLAATSIIYGLARALADGLVPGAASPEEATRLAIEVTEVFGHGLFPRSQVVCNSSDP